jgi:signal transduction histidine kinase
MATMILIMCFCGFIFGILALCYVGIKVQGCLGSKDNPQKFFTLAIIAIANIWVSIAGFILALALKAIGVIN